MKFNLKMAVVAVLALGFLSSCGHFGRGGHSCKCSQEQKQMCETCKKAAAGSAGEKKEECEECKKGS